jgi:hypothetical protein
LRRQGRQWHHGAIAKPGVRTAIVKRNKRGYELTDLDRAYSDGHFMDGDKMKAFVNMRNEKLGIDLFEAESIMVGSAGSVRAEPFPSTITLPLIGRVHLYTAKPVLWSIRWLGCRIALEQYGGVVLDLRPSRLRERRRHVGFWRQSENIPLNQAITAHVQGFGCRPLERRRRVFGGRRPKPCTAADIVVPPDEDRYRPQVGLHLRDTYQQRTSYVTTSSALRQPMAERNRPPGGKYFDRSQSLQHLSRLYRLSQQAKLG